MAGTTPNLGLYLPGGGSTGTWTPDEVADVDPINQNFVKLDAFAGQVGVQANRNQQFFGPASAISGVTGMKLGDEYQESDSNRVLWRYDGTNWVASEGAMYLIRPTAPTVSAGSVSVSADGAVEVTGLGQNLDLNGIFSSRFRKYRIIGNVVNNPATGLQFQLRNAGGVDASAVYQNGYWFQTADTAITLSQGANLVSFATTGAAIEREILDVHITDPFASSVTIFDGDCVGNPTATAKMYRHKIVCLFNAPTVFTGLRIFTPMTSFAGWFKIYGIV